MTPETTTESSTTSRRWLALLMAAFALEAAALWLALSSAWYAPLVAHVAATGCAADALRGWAPKRHRQSAARAAWAIGLAVPFAAMAFAGLLAWAAHFEQAQKRTRSAEAERLDAARDAACVRAKRRAVPGNVLALRDALESPDSETRIAAIEALRMRPARAALPALIAALDNSLFEVRTQAAQLIEEIGADYARRLGEARTSCEPDICSPVERLEFIERLLEFASLPLHTDESRLTLAEEAAGQARRLPHAFDGGAESEALLRCLLAAERTGDAAVAASRITAHGDITSPSLQTLLARVRFARRDLEGAYALARPQRTATNSPSLSRST